MTTKENPQSPKPAETETTAEATPSGAQTKIHLELEFDMLRSTLIQRCKAPTVLMGTTLRRAARATPEKIAETAEGAPRRVIIDLDLISEEIAVQTDASPLLYDGIIFMAESMVMQSQVMQRIQAMAPAAAASRILRPK